MNRSSVYYRPKTPDEEARERKEKIMGRIDWWCTQYPTWGARKIR
jgi:putative transposase